MHAWHDNITWGVSKHMGVSTHIQRASKHKGAQIYRGVSKHMGASKYTGRCPNMGASKHTGGYPNIWGIQTYRGCIQINGGHPTILGVSKHLMVSKHTVGCPNIWGYPAKQVLPLVYLILGKYH